MNETVNKQGPYTIGSTIPDWNKYKFKSLLLVIRQNSSTMYRINLFGINTFEYNINSMSFRIFINAGGKIESSGNADFNTSSIENIYMWN